MINWTGGCLGGTKVKPEEQKNIDKHIAEMKEEEMKESKKKKGGRPKGSKNKGFIAKPQHKTIDPIQLKIEEYRGLKKAANKAKKELLEMIEAD